MEGMEEIRMWGKVEICAAKVLWYDQIFANMFKDK